jgi:apolipoprotein N-acyltransferase
MASLAGAIYSLGFPGSLHSSLFFAPIMGMTIFLLSLNKFQVKQTFIHLLVFTFSASLLALWWVWPTIHRVDLSYGLIFVLPFICFPYLFIAVFMAFLHQLTSFRPQLPHLLLAIILSLCEWVAPVFFPSFPGMSWASLSPNLFWGNILGVHFYSFLSYWAAFLIYLIVKDRQLKKHLLELILLSFLFLANFLTPLSFSNIDSQKFSFRVIQSQISSIQGEADNPVGFKLGEVDMKSVEQLTSMSVQASKYPLDLIIWPETTYPFPMSSEFLVHDQLIPEHFQQIIETTNSSLLVGGIDQDFNRDRIYNSAFYFSPQKKFEGVYHKNRLFPFYETRRGLFEGDQSPLFETRNGLKFRVGICYETLFSKDFILKQSHAMADFIVNMTNDGNFHYDLAPYQHIFASRWIAIQYNIPVLRVANKGPSVIILKNGMVASLKKDNMMNIYSRSPTFYEKFGFALCLLVMLSTYVLILLTRVAVSKNKRLIRV